MKVDPAHEETEKILKAIESRLREEYGKAEREVEGKLNDYLRRFSIKDETWRGWVNDGKKTKEEYLRWRTGQIAVGKRWQEMRDTLAEDFHNANMIARSIVYGHMPEVYALNHDYGTFEAEKGARVDTSYTLYDRQAAERLLRDDPEILPPPGKAASRRIMQGQDVRWNRQQIQSAMMQSLLQGDGIPDMATRLAREVGEKNRKAAVRNARTMATGVQNAGRVDSYKRAQGMGIKMRQMWLATLDMRTRHEHRELDRQEREVGSPFTVPSTGEELEYPGDPSAPGHLIYNCRCTLRAVVDGFERRSGLNPDLSGIEKMTYEEWKENKEEKPNPILLPEEKQAAIKQSYINEYRNGPGKRKRNG